MSRQTPEGQIKLLTKNYLNSIGLIPAGKAAEAKASNTGWYFMPVSNGLGVHGIPDFVGHYQGRYFAIETKVSGKAPTPLQKHQLRALTLTGAFALVVTCEEDLKFFESWRTKI
jgi:hypothetical protein